MMTSCGGTRVNTAEWERFMSLPKLFGYQTLSCITSKKYHIIHGPSVSVSEMSIRCLYSITIWPLAITLLFPRGMVLMMITDADLLIHIATGMIDLTSQRIHSQTLQSRKQVTQITHQGNTFSKQNIKH